MIVILHCQVDWAEIYLGYQYSTCLGMSVRTFSEMIGSGGLFLNEWFNALMDSKFEQTTGKTWGSLVILVEECILPWPVLLCFLDAVRGEAFPCHSVFCDVFVLPWTGKKPSETPSQYKFFFLEAISFTYLSQ